MDKMIEPNQIWKEKSLKNCTFVKCILMLLVILGHSIVFWSGTWFTKNPAFEAPMLGKVYNWINSFHIYGFALVSGYIYRYIRIERGGYSSYSKFIKNKSLRLLVPYTFAMLVWVFPIMGYFFGYSVKTFFVDFVLANSPGQLWFLWMLFDVFILFWPLTHYLEKHNWGGLLLSIVLYLVGFIGASATYNVFQIWIALQYFGFFWMGFKLRQHQRKEFSWKFIVICTLVDIMLFVLTEVIPHTTLFYKALYLGINYLLHIVGAIMIFALLQKIASIIPENNKMVEFLAKRSMPMYLFHQQLIYFSIAWLNGKINPYMNAFCNFCFAVIASLLISELLLHSRVTRKLIGEK